MSASITCVTNSSLGSPHHPYTPASHRPSAGFHPSTIAIAAAHGSVPQYAPQANRSPCWWDSRSGMHFDRWARAAAFEQEVDKFMNNRHAMATNISHQLSSQCPNTANLQDPLQLLGKELPLFTNGGGSSAGERMPMGPHAAAKEQFMIMNSRATGGGTGIYFDSYDIGANYLIPLKERTSC